VMARDCVQQLCAHVRLQRGCASLDEAQAEVHVPEQSPLVRLVFDYTADAVRFVRPRRATR